MIAILLAVLLQDTDVDRLVEKLGDDSPEVRARAIDDLERRKSAAVPALIRARNHSELEIRSHVEDILFRLEPSLFLEALLEKQRPPKTGLLPEPHESWGPTIPMEGGWFWFRRKLWVDRRVVLGSVITTAWERSGGDARWDLTWTVAAVTVGCEVPVERCALHSPGMVYISEDCTDPVCITIRGTRRWSCEVPVTFRFPANGDRRRVGPYTLTLDWPFIEVVGTDAGPVRSLINCLPQEQIRCKPVRGRSFTPPPAPDMTLPEDPPVVFAEARPDSPAAGGWCGCRTPRKPAAEQPTGGTLRRARLGVGAWKTCPLEDLESITVGFRLPIEEPFEVTSPPLE
jgi:hypothetical protein